MKIYRNQMLYNGMFMLISKFKNHVKTMNRFFSTLLDMSKSVLNMSRLYEKAGVQMESLLLKQWKLDSKKIVIIYLYDKL